MLSDEYFKKLEEANLTSDQIDRFRGGVNRKVAQQGENASKELLFLADFLNSAEADFGNMVMQGLSFNFSDEIASKFQRKVPDNFYVAVRNNAMDAYKADKPIRATVGQVGGALIPTAVEGFFTARKIRRDKQAGPPAGVRTIKQAITDKAARFGKNPIVRSGLYGTVYSLGLDEGTAKERLLKSRPYVAGLQAMMLAVPGIITKRVLNTLGDVLIKYPAADKGTEMAQDMVREAMISDAGSVEEALKIAKEAMSKGKDLTLADTGNTQAALLELANVLPTKSSKVIRDFLEARAAGRFGRLNSDLVKAFGVEASYFETLNNLIMARKEDASDLYQDAFQVKLVNDAGDVVSTKPRLVDLDTKYEVTDKATGKTQALSINDLLNKPSMKRGVTKAATLALYDDVNLPDLRISRTIDMTGFGQDDPGFRGEQATFLVFEGGDRDGQTIEQIDLEFLHYLKMALDEEISVNTKGGQSSYGKTELKGMVTVKNQLAAILDASSPQYKQARNVFAGHVALQNALDLGLEIFDKGTYDMNPEAIVAEFNNSEQEAFRQGVFEAILRKMETAGENTNIAQKIIGNKRNRDLIRLSFPASYPEEKFNEFMENFTQEIEARAIEVRTLGNSATAQRQAMQERYKDRSMRAIQSQDMTATGIVNRMLKKDFVELDEAQTDAVAEELTKLLTETEYNRLVQNLRQGFTFGEAIGMVNPLRLPGFIKVIASVPGSPYVIGDLSAQVADALDADYEAFGDEAIQRAIDYFNEEMRRNTSSIDNARRTMPSSVADEVLPEDTVGLGEQLDTMLASLEPTDIPLVPPVTAVTPESILNETILPNPKDREIAERRMANVGIGTLT